MNEDMGYTSCDMFDVEITLVLGPVNESCAKNNQINRYCWLYNNKTPVCDEVVTYVVQFESSEG